MSLPYRPISLNQCLRMLNEKQYRPLVTIYEPKSNKIMAVSPAFTKWR